MTPIKKLKAPATPESEPVPQTKPAAGKTARSRAAKTGSARTAKSAAPSAEGSRFELNIRVDHQEMAKWSQARLAAFFDAVSVLMAAKTQSSVPPRAAGDSALLNEMRTLETRIASRFHDHEAVLTDAQRAAAATLEAMRAELTAARAHPMLTAAAPAADPAREAALHQIGATVEAVEERIRRIEHNVDSVRRHMATLHESIAEDFKTFEDNLSNHTNAIQSARTAMSQTDDLVERVVEALEVLQTSSFRHPDDASALN